MENDPQRQETSVGTFLHHVGMTQVISHSHGCCSMVIIVMMPVLLWLWCNGCYIKVIWLWLLQHCDVGLRLFCYVFIFCTLTFYYDLEILLGMNYSVDMVGKPEGKRPLRRPKGRWDYINLHLKEKRMWKFGLNSSDSGKGAMAGCFRHGNGPLGSIKCGGGD